MEHWSELLTALEPERRRAMEFLREHLPESDLDCYPPSLFLSFADHALALRREAPWCAGLEQELFDHYVLFPRVNDEDLSFHRALFRDALWPRLSGLDSDEERVLEVNRWCHEQASYQFQDDRTASPLTVFRNGSGRCGEESAFLVSALRSVGIAARQVYSPRWAHCDDNHAWVEALCGGQWRFLGACEPEPILDRGWFNTAASRAMLVHSRLFGRGSSPLHGELLGREGAVSWYNQTPRYARTRTYTLRALRDGAPAPGAVFRLQVLNEASFHTIAVLTADARGEARVQLGLGDLHVLAQLDGLRAEGDCVDGAVTLELSHPTEGSTPWRDFDAHAPKDEALHPALLTAPQKEERAQVLARGSALREAKLSALDRSGVFQGAQAELIQAARGNGDAVAAFLRQDGDPLREALLRTLTRKDLRDVTEAVLTDHLRHSVRLEGVPEEVFLPWVLCPRVELEPLTPWRQALAEAFSPEERTYFRRAPDALWGTLSDRMNVQVAQVYAGRDTGLVWTPLEAWRAGRCDGRSLRLLYVALLRALGVPARLRPLDGMPEYWRDGGFCSVLPQGLGQLELTCSQDAEPLYRQNWTLSRRTGDGWSLLRLTDDGWREGRRTLSLPAGQYRLTTSVRMPNGNQFASSREVFIPAGGQSVSDLRLRSYALEDLLGCQDMPVMPARTLDGQTVADLCRMDGRPTLLFWMEEGNEPTEHVLNELAAGQEALEKLPVGVNFMVRGRDSLSQRTLAGVLAGWPQIRVLLDDWAFDLETAARHLACDPERPPLAVVCNGQGQAVYGVSGYHVGSVELLTRIAAHLAE